MQRQSLLLVLRGLGLALLITLLLVHVATPRTYVTPGDRLTPTGPARQVREAAPGRQLLSDGAGRPGANGREGAESMGHRGPGAGRVGTD
jgi:hypothetical protein